MQGWFGVKKGLVRYEKQGDFDGVTGVLFINCNENRTAKDIHG